LQNVVQKWVSDDDPIHRKREGSFTSDLGGTLMIFIVRVISNPPKSTRAARSIENSLFRFCALLL